MEEKIKALLAEIAAFSVESEADLETYRRLYTNRKAQINTLFADFRQLPPEDKKRLGQPLNQLKQAANDRLEAFQAQLRQQNMAADRPHDLTLPGDPHMPGARHPLSIVLARIVGIFERLGYDIAEGPEIEDDWHNFTALNFPDNHPARDMQDTFFIHRNPDHLLRTHTSSVQIRAMEEGKPPFRILAPGRVYRNEAISARAHCFFHQVEGLVIDKDISFADMKQHLQFFATELFGANTQIKLRPSYFPFTEISAEMDVTCRICEGEGCNVCKYSGWLEIMGCGMVDPNVLRNCGIDPDEYSGFAFGMGVERIAQILFRVPDLRLYSQNDLRFLQQFEQF
ncbi:MAG: phenylalanine--tRNA ligase subunit alpha [Bacteroidetes bacterium]|nr:MAG: phenylalanine--tRNA ligase subunit alpha [Bacteroidota bacterium]